jgi:hypothetical protein
MSATGIACALLLLAACTWSRRTTDPGSAISAPNGSTSPSRVANTTPQPPGSSGAGQTAGRPFLFAVELEAEDPMPGGQFVLVEDPSEASIDLGCWSLRLEAPEPAMFIPSGFSLPPRSTARLYAALPDVGRIELVDPGGRVIDGTPQLSDSAHDDRIWFRTAGGWRFGRPDEPLQETVDATLLPRAAAAC